MNYIKQLQAENEALREGYAYLRAYLLSDKYSQDTTVNRDDILLRIMEIVQDADATRHRRGA